MRSECNKCLEDCLDCLDCIRRNKKSYTCFSCGIFHPNVEAEGIWYCPNALCQGCGGAWFRLKLKSCKENSDGTHCVDENEWIIKGIQYNKIHGIRRKVFRRKKK